jgi:ParB family chromosome partitioning protein
MKTGVTNMVNEETTVGLRRIPVKNLERSPLNVRRTSKGEALDELKASILAHGLMQNLVVTDDGSGTYRVIAGGRRLQAIRALHEEGKLPGDYAVPCQIVEDGRAAELSLAENVVRVAMHPADEFEAYAKLADQGHDAAAIAGRFGVAERHVLRRLKLARVAPELLAEYRAGNVDLDCLMAFAITDDHERQMAVHRSLKGWQRGDAGHIRRMLTEALVESEDRFAKFVDQSAYELAGGRVRSDLFGDEVYFEDAELLHRLVGEKLEDARRSLEAEGWGWVEVYTEHDHGVVYRCSSLRPTLAEAEVPAELLAQKEQAEAELRSLDEAEESEDELSEEHYERRERVEDVLAELEERFEEFKRYDPESMKSAGCYVSIGHDGRLVVERGLVRKKDRQRLETATVGRTAKPGGQLPQALRHDLEAYRLQVARCAIAAQPDLALDLLAFHAACQVLGGALSFDGPDIRFQGRTADTSGDVEALPLARLSDLEHFLPTGWLEGASEADQFHRFRELSDDDKRSILAFCVVATLRPGLALSKPEDATAYDVALSLTGADVALYWRPTKANYLGRLTREQLLALGGELLGQPWATERRGLKKSQLVDELDAAFASPGEHGMSPEAAERLKSWLPAGMSFAGVRWSGSGSQEAVQEE